MEDLFMRVDNNRIYYTIEDIVDLLDAIKIDGSNKLNEAADTSNNENLKYAALGYNAALRNIRRDFERINDKFIEEINKTNDVSEPVTQPQDHTELQEEDIEPEEQPNTEEASESAETEDSTKHSYAPI